jgi:hypothetical protein
MTDSLAEVLAKFFASMLVARSERRKALAQGASVGAETQGTR